MLIPLLSFRFHLTVIYEHCYPLPTLNPNINLSLNSIYPIHANTTSMHIPHTCIYNIHAYTPYLHLPHTCIYNRNVSTIVTPYCKCFHSCIKRSLGCEIANFLIFITLSAGFIVLTLTKMIKRLTMNFSNGDAHIKVSHLPQSSCISFK